MNELEILLDNNSFDFLLANINQIKKLCGNILFTHTYLQELELGKIPDILKKEQLINFKKVYTVETPGIFCINAPCVNTNCFFTNEEIMELTSKNLQKYKCQKNNRINNYVFDLTLTLTAMHSKKAVLTNDGWDSKRKQYKKEGLLPASKELGIECYSHQEFLNKFIKQGF